MAEYAIGDVQGCYDPLMRLLEHLHFDEHKDRLWFVGDLINRGPHSLAVLRFIKQLPLKPRITLGNHDLHFLMRLASKTTETYPDDTLDELLNAPDCETLATWLRYQPMLVHDEQLNVVMCHAGIPPTWSLIDAKQRAARFEQALHHDNYKTLLNQLYGNKPDFFEETLSDIDALRVICNSLTRMRLCDDKGRLVLTHKGSLEKKPSHLFPWFDTPNRQVIKADIIFGHWAALEGKCSIPHIYALDTGCVWGKTLTALRLDTKERFCVSAGVS